MVSANPIEIYNLTDLNNIRNDLTADYILMNDIDASDTINWSWDVNFGWEPIGFDFNPFTGSFDGNGNKIINLYIWSEEINQGLFSILENSIISNLGLENASIIGGDGVGAIAGHIINSTISDSYSTGTINGDFVVGGLVGSIETSNIMDSYSTGNVTGQDFVGGITGADYGFSTLSNSYSIGNISGTSNTGGLIGYVELTTQIISSYYDTNTSGRSDTDKGTPKTTEEMKTKSNYTGWDFDDIWDMDENINLGYPYLQWQNKADLGGEYSEINLTGGWNLFSIPNGYLDNEGGEINLTLKKGFNFFGYSGNNNLALKDIRINGTTWNDAVSEGIVSKYLLDFKNGFYTPFIPSVIQKSFGYIIYSFSDNVNMTIKNVLENSDNLYNLDAIRVKNRTNNKIYFLEKKKDWFYPMEDKIVYRYNETKYKTDEGYDMLNNSDSLNSWESYWIRARYENLSLIIYG